MANIHTEYPKKVLGESNLARQLAAMDDRRLHLWFALDYLPGVRDIDCVIWHEQVRVFIVEIKAVNLPMVEEFGLHSCRIRGRESEETPQHQAYMAQESLRRFLRPRMTIRPPFFVSTVCWPIISRASWKRAWGDEYISGEHADTMLFEEDISAGPESLKKRLQQFPESDKTQYSRCPSHGFGVNLEATLATSPARGEVIRSGVAMAMVAPQGRTPVSAEALVDVVRRGVAPIPAARLGQTAMSCPAARRAAGALFPAPRLPGWPVSQTGPRALCPPSTVLRGCRAPPAGARDSTRSRRRCEVPGAHASVDNASAAGPWHRCRGVLDPRDWRALGRGIVPPRRCTGPRGGPTSTATGRSPLVISGGGPPGGLRTAVPGFRACRSRWAGPRGGGRMTANARPPTAGWPSGARPPRPARAASPKTGCGPLPRLWRPSTVTGGLIAAGAPPGRLPRGARRGRPGSPPDLSPRRRDTPGRPGGSSAVARSMPGRARRRIRTGGSSFSRPGRAAMTRSTTAVGGPMDACARATCLVSGAADAPGGRAHPSPARRCRTRAITWSTTTGRARRRARWCGPGCCGQRWWWTRPSRGVAPGVGAAARVVVCRCRGLQAPAVRRPRRWRPASQPARGEGGRVIARPGRCPHGPAHPVLAHPWGQR